MQFGLFGNLHTWRLLGFFILLISLTEQSVALTHGKRTDWYSAVGQISAVGQTNACTGTLIAERTVLTAAHCFNESQKRAKFVFRNVPRVDHQGTTEDVPIDGDVYIHPDFGRLGWYTEDFVVVQLDVPAKHLVDVDPIPVLPPNVIPDVGDNLTLVGFGSWGEKCDKPGGQKRKVTLDATRVTARDIAFDHGDRHACPGDSGGPALYIYKGTVYVAGIASSIGHGSNSGYDSVFSNYYWIRRFLDDELQISGLSINSNKDYEIRRWGLKEDVTVYTDRTYTFQQVPYILKGASYIATANGDKFVSTRKFISFNVNKDVSVYIAYDDRHSIRPDWLSRFKNTGLDLFIKEPNQRLRFSLFKLDHAAGRVDLGGNYPNTDVGNNGMYAVIVDDQKWSIPGLRVSSGRYHEVVPWGLHKGALVYTDRRYTYEDVPDFLKGASFIATANDDKFEKARNFLDIELDVAASIYVAYDDRYSSKPRWLASFRDTGLDLLTKEPGRQLRHSLFKKNYPAGKLTLGGNYPNDDAGNYGMYTIVVDEVIPSNY
jgi:hypothetical protein